MANVQTQFEIFHERIRVDYDMDKNLRDKRDKILKRIRKALKESKRPGFKDLHQGSYKHRTGTKPIGSIEYDIDVGLRFSIDTSEYSASTVRNWVFEAVEGHTDKVEKKSSCIRVTYSDGYHVDIAIYAWQKEADESETFHLATKSSGWRPADPPALEDFIQNARVSYDGTEDSRTNTDQFRRTIRYLKRWYDEAIDRDSKDKPSGLAYTLLAARRGGVSRDSGGSPVDLQALRKIAFACRPLGPIQENKPTPEYEDLFAGLSGQAMESFKDKLDQLLEALDAAADEVDPVVACETLAEHFGSDFPVPEPEKTGKRTSRPAIVPSSGSA